MDNWKNYINEITHKLTIQKFWALIWGFVSALILIILGSYVSSNYFPAPYVNPVILAVVMVIFSGTVGLYFAEFWKESEDSIAVSFGFLIVLFGSMVILLHSDNLISLMLALGFFFGLAFVLSGHVNDTDRVITFFRKLLKKFSWYIFGLELTASYEIPLFQKVLNVQNVLLMLSLAVPYIIFVLIVYFYVDRKISEEKTPLF